MATGFAEKSLGRSQALLKGKEEEREPKQSRRGEENREMRGCKGLEVSETIFEEDHEEVEDEDEDEEDEWSRSRSTTPTPPLSCSPPQPPSLESIVEEWTRATGCRRDVIVRVQDHCFILHRDPLISHSRHLKRKLISTSDITVTPPEGVTADTFASAARFCYTGDAALTPTNLAAMWVAAEWLEMAATGNESLVQLTEDYFRREVAGDGDRAAVVLRECVGMLGGMAEAAAGLAVRCVEVVAETGGDERWLEELVALSSKEFRVVAEAMAAWFVHDHDLLYRIVDYYLQNHNGKMLEGEKTGVCFTVNSSRLSQHLLVDLVQNPRLPIRFVVQAMLANQLNTRHTAVDVLPVVKTPSTTDSNLTLGAILQRDAAQRQAAHLRATMQATALRIESLERDLAGMKRRLRWSEEKRVEVESARSESMRFARHGNEAAPPAVPVGKSCSSNVHHQKSGRSLGKKLVHGLKNMFRTSTVAKNGSESRASSRGDGGGVELEEEGAERRGGHRRNRSCAE